MPSSHEWLTYMEWAKEMNTGATHFWRARRRLIHAPHALLRATHNAGEDGIKSGLWHIVAFTVRHHIFIARNAKAEAMIRATEKFDY
ncbi:hypothetical protein K523DRAFT_358743 [Schizophyllum commune Tattone D]|nr:hypothetical protein K523DRAFT_358743 [Schizophyllum commune Tattone D]